MWHYTRPPCFDNEFDTSDCARYPQREAGEKEGEGGGEPALLPSTGLTFTPSHALTILHSRTPHPRRAVVVPQSTIDYASSDVTLSLSPSLANLPPVPPFVARPQSAASAVATTVRAGLPPSEVPAPLAPVIEPELPLAEEPPTPLSSAPSLRPMTRGRVTAVEEEEEGEGEGEREGEGDVDEEEEGGEGEDAAAGVGIFLVQQVVVPLWAISVVPPLTSPLPLSTNPLASPVFRPVVTALTVPYLRHRHRPDHLRPPRPRSLRLRWPPLRPSEQHRSSAAHCPGVRGEWAGRLGLVGGVGVGGGLTTVVGVGAGGGDGDAGGCGCAQSGQRVGGEGGTDRGAAYCRCRRRSDCWGRCG